MDSAASPSPSDDYVMIEQSNVHDLAIQTGIRPDETEQYLDYESSDSDLGIRSLGTSSPSPSTADEDTDDDTGADDVSRTSNVQRDLNGSINTIWQYTISGEADDLGILEHLQWPRSATQGPATTEVSPRSGGSGYVYRKSPDDAFPGAGILVPPPTAAARHPTADLNPTGSQVPTIDAAALRGSINRRHCDHTTIDQDIMDLLVENALNTRLEQEFGSSGPRELHLRQQMMARLRSLPVDHPVIKEAMKMIRWGCFLFQHQYVHVDERKHIYTNVFTDVERTALCLLLECHKKHFSFACLFADLSLTTDFEFLSQIDPNSLTEGLKLSLQVQTSCMTTMGFEEVGCLLYSDQVRARTRFEIIQQAERLENTTENRDVIEQLRRNMKSLVDTDPVNISESATLKRAHKERIITFGLFNKTLTNLTNAQDCAARTQGQLGDQRSSCPNREVLENPYTASSSCSSPAKNLSIPEAYPGTSQATTLNLQDHQESSEILFQQAKVEPEESNEAKTLPTVWKLQEGAEIPDHLPEEIKASSDKLQRWKDQFVLLEQNNKKRLMMQRQEQELSQKRLQTEKNRAALSDTNISPMQQTQYRTLEQTQQMYPFMVAQQRPIDMMQAQKNGQIGDGMPISDGVKHHRDTSVQPPTQQVQHMTAQLQQAIQKQQQLQYQQLMTAQHVAKQQQFMALQRQKAQQQAQQQQAASASHLDRSKECASQATQHSMQPAPQLSTSSIYPSSSIGHQPQDYQMQLIFLKQQRKKRLPALREPQSEQARQQDQQKNSFGITVGSSPMTVPKYTSVFSLPPLELVSPEENEVQRQAPKGYNSTRQMKPPSAGIQNEGSRGSVANTDVTSEEQPILARPFPSSASRNSVLLQDYQRQLMLLEQQNKKRVEQQNKKRVEQVEKEVLKYVEEENATKFRCRVDQNCNKLFKGRDYWRKHVANRHQEWYQATSEKVRSIEISKFRNETSKAPRREPSCEGDMGAHGGAGPTMATLPIRTARLKPSIVCAEARDSRGRDPSIHL